ncbi:hypothetical protein AKO1_008258 [Acrasis kona]|uniref:Guanylate cyclase domain-containing protein n=1 Tax=Acrasis kona TaxID=1008807 RepID=A0AAW2YPT0_9EUKA
MPTVPGAGLNISAIIVPTVIGALVLLFIFIVAAVVYVLVKRHIRIGYAPESGYMCVAFTDVQNSTSLWQQYPIDMSKALKMHNTIMRRLIKLYKGYEVKTQGDSFMVCFSNPYNAMDWAVQVQKELVDCKDWPTELLISSYDCRMEWDHMKNVVFKGLRVRIGIHMGEAERVFDPTSGRADYFGTTVNKAARIESLAKGGQIIVSHRFIRSVCDSLVNIDTGERASNEEAFNLSSLETTDTDSATQTTGTGRNSSSSPDLNLTLKRSSTRGRRRLFKRDEKYQQKDVFYRSQGEHYLKGLKGKETMYSLIPDGLMFRNFDSADGDQFNATTDAELDYTQPTTHYELSQANSSTYYDAHTPHTPSSPNTPSNIRVSLFKSNSQVFPLIQSNDKSVDFN